MGYLRSWLLDAFLLTGKHPKKLLDIQLLPVNGGDVGIAAIVKNCLQVKPGECFKSAAELAFALRDYVKHSPLDALGVTYTFKERFTLLRRRCQTEGHSIDYMKMIACVLLPYSLWIAFWATWPFDPESSFEDVRRGLPSCMVLFGAIPTAIALALVVPKQKSSTEIQHRNIPDTASKTSNQARTMGMYVIVFVGAYLLLQWRINTQDFRIGCSSQLVIEGLAFAYIGLGNRAWNWWLPFGCFLLVAAYPASIYGAHPSFIRWSGLVVMMPYAIGYSHYSSGYRGSTCLATARHRHYTQ